MMILHDHASFRPPKRKSEVWRIFLNRRYMLIRYRSGKCIAIDVRESTLVSNEIFKKLLEAEKEIITERFGEEIYQKYVKK